MGREIYLPAPFFIGSHGCWGCHKYTLFLERLRMVSLTANRLHLDKRYHFLTEPSRPHPTSAQQYLNRATGIVNSRFQ